MWDCKWARTPRSLLTDTFVLKDYHSRVTLNSLHTSKKVLYARIESLHSLDGCVIQHMPDLSKYLGSNNSHPDNRARVAIATARPHGVSEINIFARPDSVIMQQPRHLVLASSLDQQSDHFDCELRLSPHDCTWTSCSCHWPPPPSDDLAPW